MSDPWAGRRRLDDFLNTLTRSHGEAALAMTEMMMIRFGYAPHECGGFDRTQAPGRLKRVAARLRAAAAEIDVAIERLP